MAAAASKATTDTDLPELVRDSMLPVIIERDLTIHPQPFTRRNKAREEKWVRETNLGRGGYGEVWLEKKVEGDDSLPKLRAVKTIRIPENETIFELNGGRGVRELEALAKFSQDNYKDFFVKSYGWYLAPGSLNIVMEYCRHGDLKSYLERVRTIPTQEVQEIALQILGALVSMHRNGFAHRDLKPANILIKSQPPQEWWVKLCDFGLSKRQEGMDEVSTNRGTPSFEPPETLGFPFTGDPKKANPYSADLWCFGETLFRCHVGSATFEDKEQLYEYQRGNRLFPIEKLQQVRANGLATNFIHFLMLPNPAERLDTERARRHPWLRGEIDPPSSQVADNHRRRRNETGPTRITRTLTALSPSPAVESQLTDASGQWSTTATNQNLPSRPVLSQLSLAGNGLSMASRASYQPPTAFYPPPVYPGYPIPPAASQIMVVDTHQGRHDNGAQWNRSQSIQDLSRRFQRQAAVEHPDSRDTKPKKKSGQKEKQQPKVAQASGRAPAPLLKPRHSRSVLDLHVPVPVSQKFSSMSRHPHRPPNEEQGYRGTPSAEATRGHGPPSYYPSTQPPPPPPPPEYELFSGFRSTKLPLVTRREELDAYRHVRNSQRIPTLEEATADLFNSRQEQNNPQPYYRPTVPFTPVPYRGEIPEALSRPRRHGGEGNRQVPSGNASYEARPVDGAINVYGNNVEISITPARSGPQLRRARSYHGPPPPRNTTQYPARRSVDRKAHPYESSDSEDEEDIRVSIPLGNGRLAVKTDKKEVPMTADHFGG